jgi:hypothetical protein
MSATSRLEHSLSNSLSSLTHDPADVALVPAMLAALDQKHHLYNKIAREPGLKEIILQLAGRLARAYGMLSGARGKRILDIACGSNSSRAPSGLYINTPFGETRIRLRSQRGYTAQFEPWFCRMLLELGADPVGIDFGDLKGEAFEHYAADLGVPGALDFLPSHSFDGVQDSRLFGSPEFTAQFPRQAGRLQVARELRRQEKRLLKPGGIVIHSDAAELLR